jgi:hypothetical protein
VDGATRAQVTPALLALFGLAALPAAWALVLPVKWAAASVLLALVWLAGPLRRAWAEPAAGTVRGAVMAGIFGVAMVNAALCALVGAWALAAITVGLLVPGKFVGRWFYAT